MAQRNSRTTSYRNAYRASQRTNSTQTGRVRSDVRARNTGRPGAAYVYGNAAPALAYENRKLPQPRYENDRRLRILRQREENQKRRAARMSLLYLTAMLAVLCVLAMSFVWYISLQFRITNSVEQIASCQKQLMQLREDNNETLNKIESSVNLDDIKYTAITELGMTYADENQIVVYSNDAEDYVHQARVVTK